MKPQAMATFQIKSWDETPYLELLTREKSPVRMSSIPTKVISKAKEQWNT